MRNGTSQGFRPLALNTFCLLLSMAAMAAGVVTASGGPNEGAGVSGSSAEHVPPDVRACAFIYARARTVKHGTATPTVWSVIWQYGRHGEQTRLVYETTPGFEALESGVGFLPSPDGRWLHVWETIMGGQDNSPLTTQWFAVELLTGRRLQIGEQPGRVGFLPYWLDDHRLLLERGDQSTIFDVRDGRLTRPLPVMPAVPESPGRWRERYIDSKWPGDTLAVSWRVAYIQRHYASDLERLSYALAKLESELAVSPYLHLREYPCADLPEDLLLRPMGVVLLSGPSGKGDWPSVALSPDGRYLARAAVLPIGVAPAGRAGSASSQMRTFRARVDVFDLSSGERVWAAIIPRDLKQQGDVFRGLRGTSAASFRGLRWSRDGRYLSFGIPAMINGRHAISETVLERGSWKEIARIPDAYDTFVVPVAR